MKFPILDKLKEAMSSAPNWHEFYPHRIACPLGYYDPIYHSVMVAASAIMKIKNPELVPPEEMAIFEMLYKFKYPKYFVSNDFFQAVCNTKSVDVYLDEMKFPLDAMTLCLPIEASTKYFGWPVAFLSFCRQPMLLVPSVNMLYYHGNVMLPYDKPFGYYGRTPLVHELAKEEIFSNFKFKDYTAIENDEFTKVYFSSVKDKLPSVEDDKRLPVKMFSFLYKLLTIMECRDDLFITKGEQTRKVVFGRRGEVKKEALWSPNFIGYHYKAKKDAPSTGTHASPKMHWRIGHRRNQRHGPQNSLVKKIWIEPVLVNAE